VKLEKSENSDEKSLRLEKSLNELLKSENEVLLDRLEEREELELSERTALHPDESKDLTAGFEQASRR
jgi:hypothetical protein